MTSPITIVGGGLAGCEAALQIASRGIPVRVVEMRPVRSTDAHHTDGLAELVCSNSFRGDSLRNAVGLIKEEMRRAGGILMQLAEEARVPAGGALAVDRDRFSALVTERIEADPNIDLVREEVTELPGEEQGTTVIATGPLTSGALADSIIRTTGEDQLYFYDAIAPIIEADSVDADVVFARSRYGKGEGDDYLNCPMTKEEYLRFLEGVRGAELAPIKDFEEQRFFDACLPVEVMADRGEDVLRFGPMKPVGLEDPRSGDAPYAVVQLRTENVERTAYNLVGFQTRIKWSHQRDLFRRTIPGLGDAVFLRYGSVHRNTFIHGPALLDGHLRLRSAPHIRFAGQITGVEGYVESTAIGLVAGLLIAAETLGIDIPMPPEVTALGGLRRHVTGELALHGDYQPSNVNWGMLPRLRYKRHKPKRAVKRLKSSERALEALDAWTAELAELGFAVDGFRKNDIDAAFDDLRAQRADQRARDEAAGQAP